MRLSALSLILIAALAACSDVPRYGGSAPQPEARINSRYRAIEVVQVTLPAYGELEDIHLRKSDGTITRMGGLWADDPARAVTLQLARDLGAITGAISAPDPWPFRDLADVRVDVRIEDFLVAEEGAFLLSGQYFVAPETGGSDRARRFEISVPVALPLTPSVIVAARGAAVTQLATMIAEAGLR